VKGTAMGGVVLIFRFSCEYWEGWKSWTEWMHTLPRFNLLIISS